MLSVVFDTLKVNDPNGHKWTENNNGIKDAFRCPLEIIIIEDTR